MKRILAIASALVLLAGCEKYDDTPIKEALSALEDRVLALEKLNGEVAALKEIVAGSVTVASCVEADGVWTVTLSDGKSFKVHPAASAIKVPLITVIEENGKSYWGYYENDDVTYLLKDGKKIEVSAVVPSVRINEDNYIEISVDGGNTWVESSDRLETGSCMFSDIALKDDCVVLTLADGFTQYRVPLMQEAYQQFTALSGKQYFVNSETKEIAIDMVGVENYTITERPEGWKTKLEKGKLTVTAPAEGVGESEGYIKMIGVGSQTSIASVYVTIGTAPCVITISETRQVKITSESGQFFYGASRLDDFDPASLVAELAKVTNPMLSRYPIASQVDLPLADMGLEIMAGETYVVWAFPTSGETYKEEDILFQAVSSVGVAYEVLAKTFENANIYVNVKGADYYYLIPLQEDMTLETCIADLNGNYAATYNMYRHSTSFTGQLTDLVSPAQAGYAYDFLVLPVKMGRLLTDDSVTFSIELDPYNVGADIDVSLSEISRDYRSLKVNVSANNAYKTIVNVVSAEDYAANGYDNDAVLVEYLSSLVGQSYSGSYDFIADNLLSGAEYYVVAVAMDRKGTLGTPQRLKLSTRTIEPSDVVISVSKIEAALNSAKVFMSATGQIARYRYVFLKEDGADYWYNTYLENDQLVYEALVYGTCDYVEKTSDEATSGIIFTDLSFGTKYIFRVIGYDSEGHVTSLAKADVAPTVGAVVQKSDARWDEMRPEVTAQVSGNAMKLSVTFPQGCKSYVVTKMSSEEYRASCPTAARLKADYILKHSYALTFTENITDYTPADWYISLDRPYLLITWEDDSQWYEPLVIDSATGKPVN